MTNFRRRRISMKKSVLFMMAAAFLVSASYAEAAKKSKYRPRLFNPVKLISQTAPAAPAPAPASEPLPSVHDHAAPVMSTVSSGSCGCNQKPGCECSAGAELFHCVKVEDRHNIHPCAVPKIISIVDPCSCDDPCSCCGPKCVSVKICVPPCGCPEVKVSRNGRKVKYDYGKYSIEIKSSKRKGRIEIDYDD